MFEVSAGAWDVGKKFGEEAAGTGFGGGYGLLFLLEEVGDDSLKRLVVLSPDQVSQGGAAELLGGGELLLRLLARGCIGVDAKGDIPVGDGGADAGVAVSSHQVP